MTKPLRDHQHNATWIITCSNILHALSLAPRRWKKGPIGVWASHGDLCRVPLQRLRVCWIAGWEKTRLALSCSSVWNTVIQTPKIFPIALIYIWGHDSCLGGEPGTEMVANQLAKVHLQLWAGWSSLNCVPYMRVCSQMCGSHQLIWDWL